MKVDPVRTRNEILKELDPNFTPPESEAEFPQEGDKKDFRTPSLRAFGRDLTELAKRGELDPVIGRKNEIERVIQILCRRTKNNPVLLGEAGVGKTAIVEGLAQEIVVCRATVFRGNGVGSAAHYFVGTGTWGTV